MFSKCKSVSVLFFKNIFPTLQFTKETNGITFAKKLNYILLFLILFHLCLLILDNNPTPSTVLLNQNLERKENPTKHIIIFFLVFIFFWEISILSSSRNILLHISVYFFFFQNVKLSLQKLASITHVPLIKQKYFTNSN